MTHNTTAEMQVEQRDREAAESYAAEFENGDLWALGLAQAFGRHRIAVQFVLQAENNQLRARVKLLGAMMSEEGFQDPQLAKMAGEPVSLLRAAITPDKTKEKP